MARRRARSRPSTRRQDRPRPPRRPSRPARAKTPTPTRARLKAAELLALDPEARAALPALEQARLAALEARCGAQKAQWALRAKARFLRAYRQNGNVQASASAAKCGRRTVYQWLANDPHFKALYLEAHEDALDALEEEARRRAVDGYERPVYQGGKEAGRVREYSDVLLVTLLKGKRPEVFRERFEHSGPGGSPLPAPVHQTNVLIYMPENGRTRRLAEPSDPNA